MPLHLPAHVGSAAPQAVCPVWGGAFDASVVQVPSELGTLHASHEPVQALSQQYPSAQGSPPAQSVAA